MFVFPFVSRRTYEKAIAETVGCRTENSLLRDRLAKAQADLEKARKNDHRDKETGQFVTAKKQSHRDNCTCFGCYPLKARK